jgi:hypothetical protein
LRLLVQILLSACIRLANDFPAGTFLFLPKNPGSSPQSILPPPARLSDY